MLTIEEYNRLVDEISIPDIVAFASIYDAYREGDYELVQNYIDQQVNDLGRDVTAFGCGEEKRFEGKTGTGGGFIQIN